MKLISGVAVLGGAAAGVALARTPRHEQWTGRGALGATWAAGVGLAAGGVLILAARRERGAAVAVAVAAVALSDGVAGLRAAERARKRTVTAARHHGDAERRSMIESDLLHTRVEGALRRDGVGAVAPEIQAILELTRNARGAVRAPSGASSAQDFVDSSWEDMVMTVEPYDNPLDRARTWHTAEIERLTLVLTYELRLAMTALPALSPALAHGPDPLDGPPPVTAAWLASCALAASTAIAAPLITARAMERSGSRFRRRLMAIEIAIGAPVLVAVPSWPIGASVVTAVLNLWNREGEFSWSWKVPVGVAGTIGAAAVGFARTRARISDIAITLLAGAAAVLVTSSSYGAWWPFSGASLIGTTLAERRGKSRADTAAAPWLAKIERELATAERALEARGDVDGLFRVRTARVRLTQAKTRRGTVVGDIVTTAVVEMVPHSPVSGIRIDAGDTVALEVRRRGDRRRLAEAIKLLVSEAAVHGQGELDLRLRRSGRGIEVRAENLVAFGGVGEHAVDHTRAPRGRARLGELAKGLRGKALEPTEQNGRYVTGFWFPAR